MFILAAVLFTAIHPGSSFTYKLIQNLLQIIAPVFAGIFASLYALRGSIASRVARMGWLCIGLSAWFWAAGQITWTLLESAMGEQQLFPGWPDIGFLGSYPLLLAGVLLLFGHLPFSERMRVFLDSLIVAGSIGVQSWYFLVRHLWHPGVTLLEKVLGIAYPLGDIAVCFSALILFFMTAGRKEIHRSLRFLASGLILLGLADTAFSYYNLIEAEHTGGWYDWAWTSGWILIGLAAVFPFFRPISSEQEERPNGLPFLTTMMGGWRRIVFPYLFAAISLGLVTVHDSMDGIVQVSVFLLCMMLLLLIILRQILLLLENRQLAQKPQWLNEQLKQHLADREGQMRALQREMDERNRIEKELVQNRENLEELVRERTSEFEDANQQLLQARKLETVGRLAGGIAHDFNNLLTVINGYCEMLNRELRGHGVTEDYVKEILKAGKRGAGLTRQLRAFSRSQMLSPTLLDINQIITAVEKILRLLAGDHIRLELRLASKIAAIKADASQVEQVIMNLVVNAADAMPHGGTLAIETSDYQIKDAPPEGKQELPIGLYVMIKVCDTGVGMDEATLSHLFEPFFTTKPKGKGLGLGLATTYGIVQQSRGGIKVDSSPGKGTTILVLFPAAEGQVAPLEPPEPTDTACGGGETILIAEDEPGVLNLVESVLKSKGYRVLSAGQSREALKIGEDLHLRIDMLLTDVVMP
ncbi:MAG: ATP-binding protein, partial [Lentisphaerota bacterium]